MDATLVVSVVFVALIVAPALYAAVRAVRMAHDGSRLRLFEVMREKGLAAPEPMGEASVRAGAHAVRRCEFCRAQARCDELLAARDWTGLREICPNSDYIDSQRAVAR